MFIHNKGAVPESIAHLLANEVGSSYRFAFIAVKNNKLLRDSYSFEVTLIGVKVSSRIQFDRIVRNVIQVSDSARGPVPV